MSITVLIVSILNRYDILNYMLNSINLGGKYMDIKTFKGLKQLYKEIE